MVSLCLKEPRFLRKWDRETQKRSGGRKRAEKVIREKTGRERREEEKQGCVSFQQCEAAVVWSTLALPVHAEGEGPCRDLTCTFPDVCNSGFGSRSLGTGTGPESFSLSHSVKGRCQGPSLMPGWSHRNSEVTVE